MRALSLLAGTAVLALIWLGPLLNAYRESFTGQMMAHMGVVAIAAPLIAIGLRSGHAVPKRSVAVPVIASLIEFVVVWGWHVPAARALVGQSTWIAAIEQASFLGAGVFLWVACLGSGHRFPKPSKAMAFDGLAPPLPRAAAGEGRVRGRFRLNDLSKYRLNRPLTLALSRHAGAWGRGENCISDCPAAQSGAGAFGLLLTSMHMTLLGALLALSPRPLFGRDDVICFGIALDAGEDQQFGGVIMLIVSASVYLAGGIVLLARLLGAPSRRAA